jgi:RNA polymerase sigma-70 factor (ECF subfamily)
MTVGDKGIVMYAIASSSRRLLPARANTESGAIQPNQEAADRTLIRAVAGGDNGAMHALYMRHHVRVYRFILRQTNNPSLAEDLVSEVFLDVWRAAAGFKGKSQVSTWLLAIARNKLLSTLRRRCDEQLDDDAHATIEDPVDNPETLVEKKDRGAIVRKCLSQLAPIHREVLDLAYYHEKSVDEIAEIVGIPAGTVKTRMFYARNCMKGSLQLAGVSAL